MEVEPFKMINNNKAILKYFNECFGEPDRTFDALLGKTACYLLFSIYILLITSQSAELVLLSQHGGGGHSRYGRRKIFWSQSTKFRNE